MTTIDRETLTMHADVLDAMHHGKPEVAKVIRAAIAEIDELHATIEALRKPMQAGVTE